MRSLLFFILFSCCCFIAAHAVSSKDSTTKQSDTKASSTISVKNKSQEKTFIKSILAPSLKEKNEQEKGKKSKKITASKKKVIDIDQLKEIIDSLPSQDKKIITSIRKQIATWPREVFDEISDYREFIISARKVAQQKYDLLSPEAKSALESEKHLKSKLSKNTVATLESLEVDMG